ncbi:MAG: hypothetical protein BWK80_62795, partial [Desulfobacteraceae bacterium IS3]
KLRRVSKYIFAELCVFLCETLRLKILSDNFCIVKMNRKVSQSSRKVAQSFKIYLCGTLRFPLRNFAVKKKQDSTA